MQGFDGILKNASVAVNLYQRNSFEWNNMAKFLDDKGLRPSIKIAQKANADAEKFFDRIISYTNFELSMKLRMMANILQVLKDILTEMQKLGKKAVSQVVQVLNVVHVYTATRLLNIVHVNTAIRLLNIIQIKQQAKTEAGKNKSNFWLDLLQNILDKLRDKLLDRIIDPILDKIFGKKGNNAVAVTVKVKCLCNCSSTGSSKSNGKSIKDGLSSLKNGSKSLLDFTKDLLGHISLGNKANNVIKIIKGATKSIPAIDAVKGVISGLKATSALKAIKNAEMISKKVPVVGTAITLASAAVDIATAKDKKRAIVTNAGAIGGALAGAAIGSAVFPVVGTAIGGIIGGTIGSIGGEKIAGFVYDNWSKIKSKVSKVFSKGNVKTDASNQIATSQNKTSGQETNPVWVTEFKSELFACISKIASLRNNTFNITINGMNKTTDQIMNELVKKIKEAANTMGEAVVA